MNTRTDETARDPLGLGDLPLLEPDRDGWREIRQALEAGPVRQGRWQAAGGWLALAASLVLVAGIAWHQAGKGPATPGAVDEGAGLADAGSATQAADAASLPAEDTLDDLIAMSQLLESRLREMRGETSGLPAQSAIYIAELEDMIARVDGELSADPGSLDLWSQRVNLLLDLEVIFQHQWEREYGRMASL